MAGDPSGEVIFNLANESYFLNKAKLCFYGADIYRDKIKEYQNKKVHKYVVSKTILMADTVISVPKMKIHKKVGVTLNLKGFVGAIVDKNCLVHYTVGVNKHSDDLPSNANVMVKNTQKIIPPVKRHLLSQWKRLEFHL